MGLGKGFPLENHVLQTNDEHNFTRILACLIKNRSIQFSNFMVNEQTLLAVELAPKHK